MSSAESTTVRLAAYGAYVAGVGGLAMSVGGTLGWAIVAVAGLVPGGYLLAKDLEQRADVRIAKQGAPESYRPPPSRGDGAAPGPLTPPSF